MDMYMHGECDRGRAQKGVQLYLLHFTFLKNTEAKCHSVRVTNIWYFLKFI